MLSLLLAAALTLQAAPDDPAADTGPADDLAAWRSPVAGPFLTAGEYLLLKPVLRVPAAAGRREQLLIVPFDTPGGVEAYSVAVLRPRRDGYQSRLLLNTYAEEFSEVRLMRPRSRARPLIFTSEEAGSDGFMSLRVFGWRRGDYRALWQMEGVYQGGFRLDRDRRRLRLARAEQGHVEAFPRGVWRERYRWSGDRFVRVSRRWSRTRRDVRREPPASLAANSGG